MSTRSIRRVTVAATLALAGGALTPVVASAAPATPAVPGDLVAVVTRQSLLGTHSWYRQTFRGLPVLDSYYAVHTSGGTTTVDDGRLAVPATLSTTPLVAADGAVRAAVSAVTAAAATTDKTARPAKDTTAVAAPGASTGTLAVVGGDHPALVWDVVSTSAAGESETRVDARTGAVLTVRSLTKNADGSGRVFDPNPVVGLQNQNLADQQDSATAVPNAGYSTVPLPHLTRKTSLANGSWARIVAASVAVATNSNGVYSYKRADDRFEQVNAYHGIDAAQTYIQGLGFTDVNHEAQKLKIDTIPDDNSFYSPSADTITYGTGGVDDAEDLEVVWHEYGHAIQDAQVPGFGSSKQAGAIGEGFGDYWAVTMSRPNGGTDLPCVADWDATSYTSAAPHCLRRTDTGKTTADIDGEVHDDGEIWSNALWNISKALGATKTDRIVLEAQFTYAPNTTFAQAANKTVAAAQALYGSTAATKVKAAFQARKIL